jgi:hypothetical protein
LDFVREKELANHALALNDGKDTKHSLGVGQMKPQTLAMLLGLTLSNPLPVDPALREQSDNEPWSAYTSLRHEEKIGLFNLLRFPKTNILMVARQLKYLKNRSNRWPSLSPTDLLADERAMKVIASEYNLGATESAQADAYPTAYGGKVYTASGSPYLLPFFGYQLLQPPVTWRPANAGNYRVAARTSADIDSIVIHTIEGVANAGIQWFEDPASGVSAHFVVSAAGAVTQMVDVKDVAITSNYYNDRAIGIECEGFAAQAATWTPALWTALTQLCAWLCQEYGVEPVHHEGTATAGNPWTSSGLVGHYQVTPTTRTDPGQYFDWNAFVSAVQDYLIGLE